MNVLVTNDDGVKAAQLIPLLNWCRRQWNVTAVVPKFEQSGKSHGIELRRNMEAKKVASARGVTVWALDSTPADCVRFATGALGLDFDLVISGVNCGLNVGTDILYSGTVAAAEEAVMSGIPAIALSTTPENYPQALESLDAIFQFVEERQLLSLHNFYNINFPANPKGFRFTRQGGLNYTSSFEDIGGNLYFPKGRLAWTDSWDDTLDTDAVFHGYISVTPLQISRTEWEIYRLLRRE